MAESCLISQKPAVWCPLGDFFGTAPGINLYRSLITGMTEDGGYAYWYMPFKTGAVVKIELSFSGRYMGKESGFTLLEPGNLFAIAALVVSSLIFVVATAVLFWRLVRRRMNRESKGRGG